MTNVLIGFIAGILLLGIIYFCLELRKSNILRRKCDKEKERNEAVYNFRIFILKSDYDLFKQLPEYDVMLRDGKPLTIESYFPEYKNNKI